MLAATWLLTQFRGTSHPWVEPGKATCSAEIPFQAFEKSISEKKLK